MKAGKAVYGVLFLLALLAGSILFGAMAKADTMATVNYTIEQTPLVNPSFSVVVLKYDPFPVNAGDWFDLWVKVQNIGQNDAANAEFQLVPDYPFESNDSLVRDYGTVYGTQNAYKIGQNGDANEVVLKYRVKVSDNAPEGVSNLKFLSRTNKNDNTAIAVQTDLPISIAKTKTSFDVALQSVSSQESTFIVSNVGQNMAKAVSFGVESQDGVVFLSGIEPSTVGDLDRGDFTIAHMKAVPKEGTGSVKVMISYTDTAGVRNTVEKSVPVDISKVASICAQSTGTDYKWIFGIVGLLLGIFAVIVVGLMRKGRHR